VFAILEMGMNHPGEIAPLSELARPDVAIITTVEAVHTEFFSSTAEIADAKAEIFAGMGEQGIAILNRDNPHFDRLARAALARGLQVVVGFGVHPDAEVRMTDCKIDGETTEVRAILNEQPLGYVLGVAGRHWAMNSLAVITAIAAAGGNVRHTIHALSEMTAPRGRGSRHTVPLAHGTFQLIDESYNASPVSVAAAIAVLGTALPAPGGRRIAVLGDMRELGEQTVSLHVGLRTSILAHGIDLVFTAGPNMAHLHQSLPAPLRGDHADRSEDLAPMVARAVRAGDVVMVKGSAGSRTGIIVRTLNSPHINDETAGAH
ncbi:MAG: Mur ligase family protein, partial [Alphaproteobacteria bacterium]